MNAYIITIGDELLIGQVIDSNSAWIAGELNLLGIQVSEIISISDTHSHIVNTLKKLETKTDLVVITGGLGPTRDDITKTALADYMGVSMKFYPEVEEQIIRLFNKINKSPSDVLKDQCFFPSSTEIITNNLGTAPGIWLSNDRLNILSMPGVPFEMKNIMQNGGLAKINSLNPNPLTITHKTIRTSGIGEDKLAKKIDYIIDKFPSYLKVAYLPSLGGVRIRLSAIGEDKKELNNTLDKFTSQIIGELNHLVYGYDDDTLPSIIGKLLIEQNKTIASAESCTAGLIGHTLATIPGASAYYEGSVISYSNDIKMSILGVNKATLIDHGAVSEECVKEMLEGLLEKYKTDVGISISGIAGPGGGTKEKPVGTTWIAYGSKDDIRTKQIKFGRDRSTNMNRAAMAALNLIRLYLSKP